MHVLKPPRQKVTRSPHVDSIHNLVGLLGRSVQQRFQRCVWRVFVNGDDQSNLTRPGNSLKYLGPVTDGPGILRRDQSIVQQQQGVTIGLCVTDVPAADRRTATGSVYDYERLWKKTVLIDSGLDDACKRVAATTRIKWYHQLDGAGGIGCPGFAWQFVPPIQDEKRSGD
jgi:hypothetical protein